MHTTQLLVLLSAIVSVYETIAVCDGNPHNWNRTRRCDQFDPACPELYSNCTTCEGIGGIPTSDTEFTPTYCKTLLSPSELKERGLSPVLPVLPETFVNDGFHEVQIFVKRDPFCLAQIPAMVSNGSHCYKHQEGAFNYDSTQGSLRIDYLQSNTVVLPRVNMTEYFYHLPDGTVHPEITRYGVLPTPVCPCISLGAGPVLNNWAADALYLGRELLGIEFLNADNASAAAAATRGGPLTEVTFTESDADSRAAESNADSKAGGSQWRRMVVDHFMKGPHHVWTDVQSGMTVRMWQPFNGLEVLDPAKWRLGEAALPANVFKLPVQCAATARVKCIDGTNPNTTTIKDQMVALARALGLCKLLPSRCKTAGLSATPLAADNSDDTLTE